MDARTGVYVHFPWCLRKCPYCDFATRGVAREDVPHAAYADAVLAELDARAPALAGRTLDTVFFGGGTPSLWDAAALGRVLEGIRGAFGRASEDLEVTVECNPTSLDRAHAAALVEVGVGRVSVGVQALDDGRLRYLGRLHDAAGALRAVEDAASVVPRVSADFIFGTPLQAPDAFEDELRRAVDAGARHVSAYSLTIEPGTRFGELHARGRLPLAGEDETVALYLRAERTLEGLGFAHYEVSNYAIPGEQARHNAHTWRGGDYVGLGAAAVGCLTEAPGRAERWRNEPDPARYAARTGAPAVERLGPDELVREALMLGLRTAEGVDLERARRRAGVDPLAGRARALERRLARGDVTLEGGHLRVPPSRWLALDGIVADLF